MTERDRAPEGNAEPDRPQGENLNVEPDDGRTHAEPFHSHDGEFREEYASEPRLKDLRLTPLTLPRWVLLALIRGYQASLSKTLPPNTCRFYPSCSHYGYQAIYKYGALKGGVMAAWRVLRCNPFNPGGYDPVP